MPSNKREKLKHQRTQRKSFTVADKMFQKFQTILSKYFLVRAETCNGGAFKTQSNI